MVTWKLYTMPAEGPAELGEVCTIKAPRLTKRIYDRMVRSMRYEAPDPVIGMMYVDGRRVCSMYMYYDRMPDGRVLRQMSTWRGNKVVYRYSIHADGERWC